MVFGVIEIDMSKFCILLNDWFIWLIKVVNEEVVYIYLKEDKVDNYEDVNKDKVGDWYYYIMKVGF